MNPLETDDVDVIIVGAGLAGLRCAKILNDHGKTVSLVERSDYVGGRLHSIRIDDYVIDEGFQLVNPSYPEIVSSGVLKNFDLRSFDSTIRFQNGTESYELADPRKHPLSSLRGFFKSPLAISDALKLSSLFGKSLLSSARNIVAQEDMSAKEGLITSGISMSAIEDLFQPFLRGILLDDELSSSWNYTRLLLKSFAQGSPGTHPLGIEALAAAFADQLSMTTIHFNTNVQSVGPTAVVTAEGSLTAKSVVVATDGNTAQLLVGSTLPRWHSQTTWWWSLPKLENSSGLRIDLDDRLLSSALDLSSKAPERSPATRSLVAAPMNGDRPTTEFENRARTSVAKMYDVNSSDVQLITTSVVPLALPAAAPPLTLRRANVRNGVYCAGDYLETPSIQGALASGAKCARAILAN